MQMLCKIKAERKTKTIMESTQVSSDMDAVWRIGVAHSARLLSSSKTCLEWTFEKVQKPLKFWNKASKRSTYLGKSCLLFQHQLDTSVVSVP
jgi:hypothetical protein